MAVHVVWEDSGRHPCAQSNLRKTCVCMTTEMGGLGVFSLALKRRLYPGQRWVEDSTSVVLVHQAMVVLQVGTFVDFQNEKNYFMINNLKIGAE